MWVNASIKAVILAVCMSGALGCVLNQCLLAKPLDRRDQSWDVWQRGDDLSGFCNQRIWVTFNHWGKKKKKKGIKVLQRPSQRPDLNLIKTLWRDLCINEWMKSTKLPLKFWRDWWSHTEKYYIKILLLTFLPDAAVHVVFHTMLLHVEYVFIKWMCDDFVFKHVQICKSLMKEGVFPPFPHDCSSSVNM